MSKTKITQAERILAYLMAGKILTRLNSWSELGIIEAPARISELRSAGYVIETSNQPVLNRNDEIVHVAHWFMTAESIKCAEQKRAAEQAARESKQHPVAA